MKIRLAAIAAIISLLFLFLFTQSLFVIGVGKWYYWMESGVYAKYAFIQKAAHPFDCFYLINGSMRGFTNFTFAWEVIDVSALYATVDYNLTFYGVKMYTSPYGFFGSYVDLGNMSFSKTLTIRLDTLDLVENGESWGRWPYWIHGWEVGQNITLIHDYLPSPLWPGASNTTVNVTVFFAGPELVVWEVYSPIYNFSMDRLLIMGTRPLRIEFGEHDATMYYPTMLQGHYDSVSLVFLEMHMDYFTDDVIYHKLGVWEVRYGNGKLLLIDSNVNFDPSATPEETPTVSAWLVAGIATVAALPIVGVFLKLKMKHKP